MKRRRVDGDGMGVSEAKGTSTAWKCTIPSCQLRAFGACTRAFHEPVPEHLWHTRRDSAGRVDEEAERTRARALIARLPVKTVGEGNAERAVDHRFSWEETAPGSGDAALGRWSAETGGVGLQHDAFEKHLAQHPDRLKVALLLDTIRNGANVTYDGPRDGNERAVNHTTDERHLAFLREETEGDIAKGRTKGWFTAPPLPAMFFSPLHVVPKMRAGKEVGLRKIMDASSPHGTSINDGMRKILTKCLTWPFVLEALKRCGPRAWLVKRDIKSAFRHVRIRECDHHLHGIEVKGEVAYEVTLAFGVRTSPPIWDRVASALTWILQHTKGVRWEVVYYVDDFLLVVPHDEDPVAAARVFDELCVQLGLVVAHEKDEGPCTRMIFTGTGIDTESMTVFIPDDRKEELTRLVREALVTGKTRGWISLAQAATLVGKVMFACRAMPAAKPFGWRLMQHVGAGEKKVTLDATTRRDLEWWQRHLPAWNGCSMLNLSEWVDSAHISLETDASLYGWGVACGTRWAHGAWTRAEREEATRWKRASMPWMELYAIVRAAQIWGDEWSGKRITFVGDCRGLTQALNKSYLRRPAMAALLRVLADLAVTKGFEWRCRWVEGVRNVRADPLSRGKIRDFLTANPTANRSPEATRGPSPIDSAFYKRESST